MRTVFFEKEAQEEYFFKTEQGGKEREREKPF